MTKEENDQVNVYIAQLRAGHAAQLQAMQQKILDLGVKYDKAEKFNKQCLHGAYHERDMANTAVGEIVKLSKGERSSVVTNQLNRTAHVAAEIAHLNRCM